MLVGSVARRCCAQGRRYHLNGLLAKAAGVEHGAGIPPGGGKRASDRERRSVRGGVAEPRTGSKIPASARPLKSVRFINGVPFEITMQRKMRARVALRGTLFNSLAITVATAEKQQVSAANAVCCRRTNIRASASITCFMRPFLNIMGDSRHSWLRITRAVSDCYAPEEGSESPRSVSAPA